MDLQLICAARSFVGRRRNNEDALVMEPRLGLFAVADGMGGYEGGEVAAGIVADTLVDFFARNDIDAEGTWPFAEDRERGPLENLVDVALRLANREVIARKRGHLAQMGSTATVTAFRGQRLVVGNIGDSRLYRLRGGVLERLTRDDSVAEELMATGGDVVESWRHCLTKAVGMSASSECCLRREIVEPGDVYLLCSDGLWEPLSADVITRWLAAPVDEACEGLVEAAYDAGSRDNITAVVVGIQSFDHTSPPSGEAQRW